MTFPKHNNDYWEKKIVAYFHDSPDKIFSIPGHEDRAAGILEILGMQQPNDKVYKSADTLAAGIERGLFPGYHANPEKSGAVDFMQHPYLTHPISKCAPLKIAGLTTKDVDDSSIRANDVNSKLQDFLQKAIKQEPGLQTNQEVVYHKRLFFYIHLLLRFQLAKSNVAGLGALWHRIPADSRIPDHSIWHHNALTSALYSCGYDYASEKYREDQRIEAALCTFTITPVQSFINNARRLRDYWTGSVILSWLAFEGIRWVMENLGPDHILYPALTDQPLVNIYLKTSYGFRIEDNGETSDRNTIASFPNKFVCLIPFHYSEVICNEIASHIQKEWSKIVTDGFKYLCSILDLPENGSDAHQLSDLFKRQADSYWNFDWAAVKLINGEDVGKLNELLPEQDFKKNLCFYNTFKKVAEKKTYSSSQDFSISYFYNVTHTLVQKALGASKSIKYNSRKPEPGEKCSICGEFEILHSIPWKDGTSASVYSNNVKEFWEQVGKKWSNELDFSQDERKEHLCSVCFLKRGLYKILEKKRNHILSEVFKEQEGFPSTTEIALAHYFERHQIPNGRERKRIAQEIHKNEEIKKSDLTIRDRYFALLLMDGDHMGKLVSGESINASWRSVLQLELSKKLVENPSIDEDYRNAWKKSIDQTRLLTPAIHEAISESLGDFALYCVAPIIEKYGGKLVYAGGDDVCAFLPVHTALEAALKIRETYHHAFRLIDKNGNLKVPLGNWQIEEGKLSIGLGKGKDISISASLLFFHHKENLKWCMHEAHLVLDKIAKEQNGRNSLAVGLYKRSGGEPKLYVRKWEEGTSLNSGLENSVWSCLQNVATAIANSGKPKELSRSLVYNLAKNRPALLSLAKLKNKEEALNCLQLYILSQLDRSSIKSAQPNELAKDIANIIWDPSKEWENSISTNGLIIASFLANQ